MQQVLITATPKADGTTDFNVQLADGTDRDGALKLLGQAVLVIASQPAIRPLLVPATPDQVAAVKAG